MIRKINTDANTKPDTDTNNNIRKLMELNECNLCQTLICVGH